ncbi:MAG TPA: IclR family transcriptional regulator [Burkholderiaceae bacterium]|nr:IclR family transcriptional regulator [Burkholderiaceae bacterium]
MPRSAPTEEFEQDESAASGSGHGRGETGSLQRGLALVEALQMAQRPVSATELAEATGQPLSTVHRLLQVLIQQSYVLRDDNKRYLAGPKALLPLNLYHPLNVLRRDAREYLRTLRDQFRQTATLIVFLGMERLIVELAIENESISPYQATHLKSPLHGAASGKVLLASLTRAQRGRLLGAGPLERRTPNTITDLAALERELDLVRTQGFAVAVDENHVGLSATAAPIQAGPDQVIGCFVLAGLTSKFPRETVHAAGHVVKMTADLFSIGTSAMRPMATALAKEPSALGSTD